MLYRNLTGASSGLKRPADYKKHSVALITENGNYLVNYHGKCLYTHPNMMCAIIYTHILKVAVCANKNKQLPCFVRYQRE